jgi:hypothetical protein
MRLSRWVDLGCSGCGAGIAVHFGLVDQVHGDVECTARPARMTIHSSPKRVYAGPPERSHGAIVAMRMAGALPIAAKRYASHAPPTALRLRAIPYAILQEAIVRKYSISIRNLFAANVSI